MILTNIHYCRECRLSNSHTIKDVKNAYLENPNNLKINIAKSDLGILEDYAKKNIIKKPSHFSSIARMASEIKKEWKPGRRLSVSFLGGQKSVIDRVIRHAKIWMDYANIEFDFKSRTKPSDIRISFDKKDGSWSAVGTQILSIDKTEATMNFGWLTPTLDELEYSRVVLHEFGHSLACIHEHERPDNGIPWDKPKVYQYYKETDGWDKDEVDSQVFGQYDVSQIRANKLDKHSIMMYAVPNELTKGDFEIGWNNTLSENDKKFIAKLYPHR